MSEKITTYWTQVHDLYKFKLYDDDYEMIKKDDLIKLLEYRKDRFKKSKDITTYPTYIVLYDTLITEINEIIEILNGEE